MKHHLVSALGWSALAIALTACGSDSSVTGSSPSLALTADDTVAAVAAASGAATTGDLDVINSVETTIGFALVPSHGAGASMSLAEPVSAAGYGAATGCVLNTLTDVFTCAATTNNGLTLIRSFEFFNAAGQPMTQFNDSLTASVNVQTTEAGVRPTATGADTINGSRNLTASGLAGANTTRIWNGTGSHTDGGYYADSAAARTYDLSFASTFANIVVALPRSANPYPVSGTITRQVNGSGTVTKNGKSKAYTVSRTVTITFNGSEFVPMTVGSTSYTLDLATGVATKT